MDDLNKAAKEKFVTGHVPSTPAEVAELMIYGVFCLFVHNFVINRFHRRKSHFQMLLIEFLLFVPLLLLGLSYGVPAFIKYIMGVLFVVACILYQKEPETIRVSFKKHPLLTCFRATAFMTTAICILAVDFNLLPRKFCKTEKYGTGFMDIGVGAYIVCSGIVSREARASAAPSFWRSLTTVLALFTLGCFRMFLIRFFNYQHVPTEYGMHWNFFFTLAFVKCASFLILSLVRQIGLIAFISAMILAIYQYNLSCKNAAFENFLLEDPLERESSEGIIYGNREGIASSVGFLSLYLASIVLGRFILTRKTSSKTVIHLTSLALLFYVILYQLDHYGYPVSRRLANLPYVIWVLAYCCHMLGMMLVVELITSLPELSYMIPSVNQNSLLYFLCANVVTGSINLSINTLILSHYQAFLILFSYMFVNQYFVSELHKKKFSLKLR